MNNKVKLIRVSKDMQQKDLALKVGISRQTLSLIEKGQYNPSLKLCVNIAEALDSDLNTLFWKV
ncbi:helix-turn-helix transcriptional regulator [Apilactobacillus micheneri]|uniref:Transcriptional regulator n=1 Tax=Apilactobacillus micheneri TaxID=1899430 RepID=A0A9Q8MTT6_9LACO|nr:helix-turn-helix transcriptional regulator [Apilactobacillus micheneri]TPR40009.1 transcriptional regulator [Apilactobacillus micheneri]TPR41820.1 transcriptional regulator [Apilactobacillus micheneri]TPR44211.1 transcriptional regulator [Apilactobacillus micheneri]TPR45835.1 transcriptional regulator [Apilactobacillus micheneri]TPR50579.1 transcriptional regulator [Apilactobacillus micheneri]